MKKKYPSSIAFFGIAILFFLTQISYGDRQVALGDQTETSLAKAYSESGHVPSPDYPVEISDHDSIDNNFGQSVMRRDQFKATKRI
jgi:hypothetical protein